MQAELKGRHLAAGQQEDPGRSLIFLAIGLLRGDQLHRLALQRQREFQTFRQLPWSEHLIALHGHKPILANLQKPVAAGLDLHGQFAGTEHRLLGGKPDYGAKTPHRFRHIISPVIDVQGDHPEHDADDHQHHQDLDQGEAGTAPGHKARLVIQDSSCRGRR